MSLPEIQNMTMWAAIGAVCAILLYDVWAILKGGIKASVSYMVIMVWTKKYPAIPFVAGFICGHLFWPLSTCL